AMAARSSCRAPSSDAFSPPAREGWACPAEASVREGGPPVDAGRVIDMMGTFQGSAPSYDGAKAGDPSRASRTALVREPDTRGHNHFVRLRFAIFIHIE